jgi:nitroimidazol reductase NimA-like FMN-containing flavoprotein (pyridoxamine 5'-phosphate oxidase superfamily)
MGKTITSDRPYAPGYGILTREKGSGLLPWSWVTEHLSKAHTYWIATIREDSRPHVMPVWGIWLDDVFYFSSGRNSRKVRNLTRNPHVVISTGDDDVGIVVEGRAEEFGEDALKKKIIAVYKEKYGSDLEEMEEPVFAIYPDVVFGLLESNFVGSATRWKIS